MVSGLPATNEPGTKSNESRSFAPVAASQKISPNMAPPPEIGPLPAAAADPPFITFESRCNRATNWPEPGARLMAGVPVAPTTPELANHGLVLSDASMSVMTHVNPGDAGRMIEA